jgi:hypothetical protein
MNRHPSGIPALTGRRHLPVLVAVFRTAISPVDIPHVLRDTPVYTPQEAAWLPINPIFCRALWT